MKIKGLIVLFVFLILIILLSLSNRQRDNTVSLTQEEYLQNTQSTGYTQSQPLPITPATAGAPLIKSGITVIKTPLKEPENQVPPAQAQKITEKTGKSSSTSISSDTTTQEDTPQQAGITILGKKPAPKEVKEMNSAGIVMY